MFFSLKKILHHMKTMKIKELQKTLLEKKFLPKRRFPEGKHTYYILIAPKVPVQPSCPTTVLTYHFFRFGGLMLVMGRQRLLVVLLGLSLLFGHHSLCLAYRPAGTVGGTRGREKQEQTQGKYDNSSHRSSFIELQR